MPVTVSRARRYVTQLSHPIAARMASTSNVDGRKSQLSSQRPVFPGTAGAANCTVAARHGKDRQGVGRRGFETPFGCSVQLRSSGVSWIQEECGLLRAQPLLEPAAVLSFWHLLKATRPLYSLRTLRPTVVAIMWNGFIYNNSHVPSG